MGKLSAILLVGPRPDRGHVLVPWSLVSRLDDRRILLAKMPTPGASARRARANEPEGEAAGASPASAVGERSRTEAPGPESAAEPARRTRRARQ